MSSRKSLGVNELRSPAEAVCFYHQDALFHPPRHLSVHIFLSTPVILVPFSKYILGFFPLCPSSHLTLPFFFLLSLKIFFFSSFSALSGFTTHLGSLQWHCFYSSEAEGP